MLAAPPGQTSPVWQSYIRTILSRAACLKCEGQEHQCLCLCLPFILLPLTDIQRELLSGEWQQCTEMYQEINSSE